MPAYAYRCDDCGAAFERRMSISAYSSGEKAPCPDCGSERTERTFGSINVLTATRGSGGCAPSGFG